MTISLFIYPATLRGVIPCVPDLAEEMVEELPALTILNLHSLFFNGSHFHYLTSILTHMRWCDETGDGGNCITG